jgi:hypothetical protein
MVTVPVVRGTMEKYPLLSVIAAVLVSLIKTVAAKSG